MKSRREQLLGYLLGALDAAEVRQMETELDENPALRVEMARYQELLSRLGMDEEPEEFEPPRGLADRTVDFVAESADAATVANSSLAPLVRLSPSGPAPGDSGRNYSFTDIVVACSVLLTFGALLFPSINQMRMSAQRATCQYRMIQTGAALWEYALVQPNRNYPWIPETGNLAVAGNVPLTVRNAGFSLSRQNLLCPATGPRACASGSTDPTVEEVENATGCELRRCQQKIGGDYAYNMGYMSDGRLVASTMGSREGFALIADAPGDSIRPAHDGRGVNVLYEDGHLRFLSKLPSVVASRLPSVSASGLRGVGDDPFHNRNGYSAAGLDANDSALGPSDAHPLPFGDE